MSGDNGDDIVSGDQGDDTESGDAGNDHVSGGAGNDHLFGDDRGDTHGREDGNDTLDSGSGHDQMDGGAGDNVEHGDGNVTCSSPVARATTAAATADEFGPRFPPARPDGEGSHPPPGRLPAGRLTPVEPLTDRPIARTHVLPARARVPRPTGCPRRPRITGLTRRQRRAHRQRIGAIGARARSGGLGFVIWCSVDNIEFAAIFPRAGAAGAWRSRPRAGRSVQNLAEAGPTG